MCRSKEEYLGGQVIDLTPACPKRVLGTVVQNADVNDATRMGGFPISGNHRDNDIGRGRQLGGLSRIAQGAVTLVGFGAPPLTMKEIMAKAKK